MAICIDDIGQREVLNIRIADSYKKWIYSEIIITMIQLGLTRGNLVISEAHGGLTMAIPRLVRASAG